VPTALLLKSGFERYLGIYEKNLSAKSKKKKKATWFFKAYVQ
jgi:hypothetical protein